MVALGAESKFDRRNRSKRKRGGFVGTAFVTALSVGGVAGGLEAYKPGSLQRTLEFVKTSADKAIQERFDGGENTAQTISQAVEGESRADLIAIMRNDPGFQFIQEEDIESIYRKRDGNIYMRLKGDVPGTDRQVTF